jgi:anti-anti-sigma factor
MDITTTKTRGGISVVSVEGELDLYNANRLKEVAVRLLNKHEPRFIVDLARLTYVDSSGIGVILYIYTGAQKRGLSVYFTGLGGDVAKVVSLTKLDGFLPILDTIDQATERLLAENGSGGRREIKEIRVSSESPLFDTDGMYHKTFYIDLSQVRRLSNLVAQKAPKHLQEINILEQQISELIKNAVKHGNGNDKSKGVSIWFRFTAYEARLIVQDEGPGFARIEEWNDFYRRKIECYRNNDFDQMMSFLSFRTEESSEADGGNALFAAIEYWDGGLVFNDARNAVAVKKTFG